LTTAVITFPLSLFFKTLPRWTDLSFLQDSGFSAFNVQSGLFEIPFLDRMGFVFLICVLFMVIISLADPKSKNNPKGLEIDATMFKPQGSFAVGAVIVFGILAALYIIFW
jgi:SSS family solute:Na+ symporter